MRASIVINTYNRASSLAQTLLSLGHLDCSEFEVVVVNGPSTDDTDKVLASYREGIKIGSCAVANLSVSRNIGIAMAAGNVVAFIDDDAIPEPEWLTRILAGYDSDEIGAVGGPTFDYTGYRFQARFTVCDRFGGSRLEDGINPTPYFNLPSGREYCALLGTNATFRRDLLAGIGGFDEEFEYYLDETDVCVRMVDSGHVVKFVDDAFIHHKFLPSHVRNDRRVVTNWYSIIKNATYFAVKNAGSTHSLEEIIRRTQQFISDKRKDVVWAVGEGLVDGGAVKDYDEAASRGLSDGLQRGLTKPRKLAVRERLSCPQEAFRPFSTLRRPDGGRLTLCFMSQDHPSDSPGGIARFTADLAFDIGRIGHTVHLLTRGRDHHRVDFEDGVWVHRIVPSHHARPALPDGVEVPQHIWDYSASMLDELLRIGTHREIDAVEAPIWDVEGIAVLLHGQHTLVTGLQTTLATARQTHPEWQKDAKWTRDFAKPVLALERLLFLRSAGIHASSHAVVQSIESAYGISFNRASLAVIPHGLRDRRPAVLSDEGRSTIDVLFVGRLEKRKGIDSLLEIVPRMLARHPLLRFLIVGDNTLANERGRTYREEFLEAHGSADIGPRIAFMGKVPDNELHQLYASCNIFVAPSRYESFGLVLLEAMACGKPVIGGREGGMAEIIEDGGCGFLVDPDDSASLERALGQLVESSELRATFGRRSRQIFEERYLAERMARDTLAFFEKVIASPMQPSVAK